MDVYRPAYSMDVHRPPAYSMDIDFGKPTGVKKTSAQITNYKFEDLLNSQIVAVTNFPSKNIAGPTNIAP